MSQLQEVEKFWAKVCFDPNYQPEGRFQTYRELVYQGMADVLTSICPVAHAILSEAEWRQIFWEFLRKAPPRSAILRQLPAEVSQFLRDNSYNLESRYPFLAELMEYEYLEVQVRFAPEPQSVCVSGILQINPAHVLRHYTWPVHYISEENCDPETLPRGDYFLSLWRDPQTLEVRFMEVSSLVASLLEILGSGVVDGREALEQLSKTLEIQPSEEFLNEGFALLENFRQKGILLSL